MPQNKEIRDVLRKRIEQIRATYPPEASVQIQVSPEEAAVLFEGPLPERYKDYPAALRRDPKPSHILFFPNDLESLIDYEPPKKEGHKPADVR